jgi:hypothetical protein
VGMAMDKIMMLYARLAIADDAIATAKRDDPGLEAAQKTMQECRDVFAPTKTATFEAKDALAALERTLVILGNSHSEKVTLAKSKVRDSIAVLQPLVTT